MQTAGHAGRGARGTGPRRCGGPGRRPLDSLRGSIANFGNGAAEELAARLEQLGTTGELAGAVDTLTALDDALRRLHQALTLMVRRPQDDP